MTTMMQVKNKDDKVQLKAILTDADGNPLSGKLINFYKSYDGTTWELIDQKTTDSQGVAITDDMTDRSCYYKARFNGDEVYDSSEAIKYYQVKVPKPPPIAWWIIVIVIILLLIAIILLLIKEK